MKPEIKERARKDFARRFPRHVRDQLGAEALDMMARTWLDGYTHGARYGAGVMMDAAAALASRCLAVDEENAAALEES